MNPAIFELLSEGIQNELSKDFLLKFVKLNKEINEEFLKRESELREIIKHNYKIGYKFASIGDKYDKEENDILMPIKS